MVRSCLLLPCFNQVEHKGLHWTNYLTETLEEVLFRPLICVKTQEGVGKKENSSFLLHLINSINHLDGSRVLVSVQTHQEFFGKKGCFNLTRSLILT